VSAAERANPTVHAEQEIGTALFDRSNKKLKLTSAGASFLQDAKILAHAQSAVRVAKAIGNGQSGQIKIAFVSPLGGMFLPGVMRSFRQKFPLVDVDLLEMVPRKQVEALLENQLIWHLFLGPRLSQQASVPSNP
jgi:DNA-binding transcriptional LysR family regulator